MKILFPKALRAHAQAWRDCHACPLGKTAKHHIFYRGLLKIDLLFIEEAPGNSEDVIGFPFVGPAGRLLDRIVAAVQTQRPHRAGFSNVLACAPWQDGLGRDRLVRSPSLSEAKACRPRLQELVEIVKPKGLILVGASASKHVTWCKLPKASILHPAAMLRKENYLQDFDSAVTTICLLFKKFP